MKTKKFLTGSLFNLKPLNIQTYLSFNKFSIRLFGGGHNHSHNHGHAKEHGHDHGHEQGH